MDGVEPWNLAMTEERLILLGFESEKTANGDRTYYLKCPENLFNSKPAEEDEEGEKHTEESKKDSKEESSPLPV